MKRFLKVKRRCWFMLGASLAVLSVVSVLQWRGLPQALQPDGERQALLTEKARLAPFTGEQLQSLRSELARAEARATTAEPALTGEWQSTALPAGADGAIRTRYAAKSPLRWSEIIDDIARLESIGRIETLDVRSHGTRHRRDIASVEVVVAANPGTTRRQANAPFPEAIGPAWPRKVGPGPSLAPSRPDPPG